MPEDIIIIFFINYLKQTALKRKMALNLKNQ